MYADKCYVGSMENMNVKWTDGGGEAIVDVTLMGSAKENGIVASVSITRYLREQAEGS